MASTAMRFTALALLLLLAAPHSDAATGGRGWVFDLRGDLLTFEGRSVPLREVLTAFAEAGVVCRMDPALDRPVTARFHAKPLPEAMDSLLGNVNYVLRWEVVPGPIGAWTRLASIFVVEPGQEDSPRAVDVMAAASALPRADRVERELVLRFAPGVTRAQANALLRELGAQPLDGIFALGIYRIRFGPDTDMDAVMRALDADARVAAHEPNYRVDAPPPQILGPVDDMAATTPLVRGDAQAVAVIDSGVALTTDLRAVVLGGFDIPSGTTNLLDSVGHGTQMALVAAGLVGPTGTAAQEHAVPIVAIRAFRPDGSATSFELIRSVGIAVESGARVLNLSWYAEGDSAFLREALALAAQRNAVVVAAAGNDPTGRAVYPAAFDGVIAVSAVLPDGRIWERSNYGPFVDFAAPAVADLPVGYQGDPGRYAGTSISSAYVSGLVARYLARHPTATPREVRDRLLAVVQAHAPSPAPAGHGVGVLTPAAARAFLE